MILLYHKVHPESKTCWWVDVEAFYQQMLALHGRKVVYLDDYDPADPNQVVITFDGVYRNILEYAAPLLEEFGYPFELFITSDYIGRDNAFDTGEPSATFADETELTALIAMGGRLQWHSRTHVNLARITDRECIRFELGVPENLRRLDPSGFRWFAYPHGDFNEIVVEEARVRFAGGLSCIQGNDHDRFVLNRQIVTNDTVIKPRGRVAVIIASYNYGCYLPEAVESVLRQTRLPDEIHIVDDCSDDNTEEIGRYFADKRPGQTQFHRNVNNLGIVKNFNDAVSRTCSDYICILGADNRMRSDYIERLAALLDIHSNAAVAYTDFALFGPRAGVIYNQFPSEQRGRVIRDYFYLISFPDFTPDARQLLEHGNFIHGSSMFRRTAYEQVGGYLREDGVPEDYHLFLRIVRAGWGAIRCPLPLLEYRQHSREQANIRLSTHAEAQFYRKVVAERDGQIASLHQAMAERDGQIANLTQAMAGRDGQIAALNQTLEEILSSRSWRVTQPIRAISASVNAYCLKAREVLLPSLIKPAALFNIRTILNRVVRRLRRVVLTSRLSARTSRFFSVDTPVDYQEAFKETCKKNLILISMVKNEASIIEAFCGHALSLFDRIILIDHRSTDGTKQYVEALGKQYPVVEHFVFDEPGYYQSQLMTWIVRNVIDREAPSWVFFLDADEFLPFESREELNRELAKHNSSPVISMPWLNLVPLDMQSGQVLGGRFLKPNRYATHCKIAIQANLIPWDDYIVAQGNHALLMGSDYGVEFPAKSAFPIYHFPIRTIQQLRKKILHGVESYRSMGASRADGLGVHWDEINQIMNSHGLTNELMADMIVRYGEPMTPPYEKTFDELIANGHTIMQVNVSYSNPLSMLDVVQPSTVSVEDVKSHTADVKDMKEWNHLALDSGKRILRFQ